MFKKAIIGALVIGLITTSCNNDDDSEIVIPESNLTLNLNGLEDLGSDYLYEGWVIVNGAPVSTGTFSVNSAGELSSTSFQVNTESLNAATSFVLTIEPNPDSDPAPADTKLLSGDFGTGNSATLGLGPVGEGDFLSSAGEFFLRTPTDEAPGTANNGNDEFGVWFGTPGMPPLASLMLPTLKEGWKYEGWVVSNGVPISTGTFTMNNTADDNAGDANGFSETASNGPQLPGEDFFRNAPDGVTFPLDVREKAVVISIEPFPDNSVAPFLLKPLVGTAGTETAPTTYAFELNDASFPSGNVSR
ncbi:anti-sigma factor [Aquimarina sediminis]|uniref:anti-sigma factor n=1 Tax=Aquimarina sediminis TaxID=2070536 RepID=UPI000CA04A6C|nr:anti-sigma factor [Aquimarina sediminis]